MIIKDVYQEIYAVALKYEGYDIHSADYKKEYERLLVAGKLSDGMDKALVDYLEGKGDFGADGRFKDMELEYTCE